MCCLIGRLKQESELKSTL